MTNYLFLAAIGPVQELIATARRSRDLWFGSYLLSELSRAAAQALESIGAELIFPSDSTGWRIVNRVLAKVETSEQPAAIGKAVSSAVQQRLQQLRDQAFASAHWGPEDAELRALAERQVDDLYELFWVATPLTEETYKEARNRVEDLMAARKATREFQPSPVAPGQRLPKSSLDGSRESVIPERYYPAPLKDADSQQRIAAATARERLALRLYTDFGAGAAERLSGIDLLKRHGELPGSEGEGDRGDFPSTSHMAMLAQVHRLSQRDEIIQARRWLEHRLQELGVNMYQVKLDARYTNNLTDRIDGGILFASRLAEDIVDADKREQAQRAVREFLETALDISELQPYYALLIADGDNMGKAIDAQSTAAGHRNISAALSRFAAGVRGIVESSDHHGALIYAGGDDVMAYLPLNRALSCGRALARSFAEHLAPFTFTDDVTGEQRSATLSAGIAIVHHLEPLSDALALARTAEARAKQVPGKAAVYLTIDKRSGAQRSISGRWDDAAFSGRFEQMVGWFRDNRLPRGYAYQLRELAMQLGLLHVNGTENRNARPVLKEIARLEAVRILKRKRPENGTVQVDEAVVAAVEGMLGPPGNSDGGAIGIAQLIDELIVAHELRWASIESNGKGSKHGDLAD